MKVFAPRWSILLAVLAVSGCQDNPSLRTTASGDPEADLKVSLSRLGPNEQRIAEQQKYCPIMEGVRLGEMGPPCKVEVRGVSAFVCCENCVRAAQEDPDRALAQIRRLKQDRANELAPRAMNWLSKSQSAAPGHGSAPTK